MPIYMKYGTIDGGVTAAGLKGWIELESFTWGVTNTRSVTGGSHLNVSDITIDKMVDKASVPLLKQLVFGKPTNGVMMKFYKLIRTVQTLYLEITLDNTLVSSYSLGAEGGSGGAPARESLSLNFAKLNIQYSGQTAFGIVVPPPA